MAEPRLGGSRQQRRERQRRESAIEARREAQGIEALGEPLPAPTNLGPAGARVWDLVMCERYRTITAAEVPALERYANLTDRRQELVGIISREGWSSPGSRPGMAIIRPEAALLDSTDTQLRQLERQFGLTPAFRAKLQIDVLVADRELQAAQKRRAAPDPVADEILRRNRVRAD